MSDKAFADADDGEGVYLIPEERKIAAPFDGTVTDISPDGCTILLKSANGLELKIMADFGKDVICKTHIRKGQKINKGKLLISSDDKSVANIGVAVIVTNSENYLGVLPVFSKHVDYGDMLITTIVSETL